MSWIFYCKFLKGFSWGFSWGFSRCYWMGPLRSAGSAGLFLFLARRGSEFATDRRRSPRRATHWCRPRGQSLPPRQSSRIRHSLPPSSGAVLLVMPDAPSSSWCKIQLILSEGCLSLYLLSLSLNPLIAIFLPCLSKTLFRIDRRIALATQQIPEFHDEVSQVRWEWGHRQIFGINVPHTYTQT